MYKPIQDGVVSLTDWITSGATVATAIATGFGGFAAWLLYRHERNKDLPIIEILNIRRDQDDELFVRVRIRNRLPEILIVNRLEVLCPRAATASLGHTEAGGMRRPAIRPTSRRIDHEWEIEGAESYEIDLFVYPPEGWRSGQIALSLRVSTRSRTIRDRRKTIKQFVNAPIIRQADPSADHPD
jgi:hypothetical protein